MPVTINTAISGTPIDPANVAITGGSINNVTQSGFVVASLPAGTVGQRGHVTDALTPVIGNLVVGGGAVVVSVFRNSTGWIVN